MIQLELLSFFSNIKDCLLDITTITMTIDNKKISISLLENNIDECIKKWTLKKIKKNLDILDEHYYNGQGLVSDNCYDKLSDYYYEQIGHKKETIGALIKGTKIKLPLHMGSMDKVKPNSTELKNFLHKYTNSKCV